ncbi:MAG: hypothetical protein ABJC61_14740 [Acidobacteriota bacterium]
MRAFLAVARREIVEKRFVLAAAAVASLIPLAVPILRRLSEGPAKEARGLAAVVVALLIAAGLAVSLGASLFAADFANRKIGFYFSRPISAFSLWSGKIVGAIALVLLSTFVVFLPTLLADRDLEPLRKASGGPAGAVALLTGSLLLLLALANAGAIIVRSWSALALADLALVTAIGTLFVLTLNRLVAHSADPPFVESRVLAGAGVTLLIALLAASYLAVSLGRTDLRAAHRALSAAAWGILGTAAIAFALHAQWALSAPPQALARLSHARPIGPDGWVHVEGIARGTSAEFLFDVRTGEFRRTRASRWMVAGSGDGRVAAWLDSEKGYGGPWRVRTLNLRDPGVSPRETKIVVPHASSILLSGDGARLGTIAGGTLSVFDLSSGRSLLSARIPVPDPDPHWAAAVFAGPSVVRVFRGRVVESHTKSLDIYDLDLVGKKWTRTAAALDLGRVWTTMSGDRLIGVSEKGGRVTLHDGRSGAVLSTLYAGAPLFPIIPRFLTDGRIAMALGNESGNWLEVFSEMGTGGRRIQIGPGSLHVGGEVAPGRLALARGPARTLEIVDIDHGTSKNVAEGLVPLEDFGWIVSLAGPGREAAKLFLDGEGRLVRYDPATGQRRILLGRPSRD